ncbi:MAG: hypothetical protein CMI54_05820 [Parcubacteria group bacterium]|nr:hypothetical protein [Parcubacteria group bacterium]|tara:strand:- start:8781 stop:8960 length:180 start_codon:yes stop_codon:yes gene_type:complete
MKDLEVNGTRVRVTKYKVMIYDEHDKIKEKEAKLIAIYLRNEGFIKKDEFPVEIIRPNN